MIEFGLLEDVLHSICQDPESYKELSLIVHRLNLLLFSIGVAIGVGSALFCIFYGRNWQRLAVIPCMIAWIWICGSVIVHVIRFVACNETMMFIEP